MDRQAAIDYIEGMTGSYGVYHDWSDEAIYRLYHYVCMHRDDYNELNLDDARRVGITL